YGYDPFTNATAEELDIAGIYQFPEKIEEADFVVLTCALTKSSYHLVNKEALSKMKDGVLIVNVSRGGLIDEPALVEALQSGKVKAAALDVFEQEPLSTLNPLLKFE